MPLDEDSIEGDEDMPIKYFHIQSCGPGGIAQADGGFAKKLFDHCSKVSKRTPDANFMLWPIDFTKVRWNPGQIIMEGGAQYLMPFGQHALEHTLKNALGNALQEALPPKEESKI